MIVLFLIACGDLTPGERVLGEEVAARIFEMEAGQGRTLGLYGDEIVTTDPPMVGNWRNDGWSAVAMESVRRVGHGDAGAWAWLPDGEVMSIPDGEHLGSVQGATAVDRCPDGRVVAVYGQGESIACGEDGLLFTTCREERCVVHGAASSEEVSPGGALGWWRGQACWGDPMLEVEEGRGRVTCDDGTTVDGKPGDHLGLALAGGRVAGRFNRHIVPPRLRIMSLDIKKDTWIIDSAAENSRVGLSQHEGSVAVGVPEFRRGDSGARIYVVEAN